MPESWLWLGLAECFLSVLLWLAVEVGRVWWEGGPVEGWVIIVVRVNVRAEWIWAVPSQEACPGCPCSVGRT